jgi:glycosyltransferase involved in cell wall biosynthesis
VAASQASLAELDKEAGSVNITVLITTRGRSASLRRTLDSLLIPENLLVPNWEVLVIIDSDASDGSREVCEDFASKFSSHFRFLIQNGSGKSRAVNVGIVSARGDLLAFTDDDVLVTPNYLQGIHSTFTNYPADAAQGRVILDCDGGLPHWMGRRQLEFMSWCEYGEAVQEWTHRSLFGTNMVVRTQAARAVGGFSLELGAGTVVGFAEDTEFSFRLRMAGYKFIYAPQITVRHQLPKNRMTRSFFRTRYYRLGRAQAYYVSLPDVPVWRFGLYSMKYALLKEVEALWHRVTNRPAEALDCQCYGREKLGLFLQHYYFSRGQQRRLTQATFHSEEWASSGVAVSPK